MDPDTLLALLAARETDETSGDGEMSAKLQQALRELPSEQAKPVVMMTFYGLTAAEIATRDDIPVGTVKTRIRRGLQALRQRLGVGDV
jgi:RNA polymerase sigma-70 factor (ECF subfamily)